jgi:hypothetical protein
MAAISATCHHTARTAAGRNLPRLPSEVCGRRQRPAGVVLWWMCWWRSDLGFAHASFCALRALRSAPTDPLLMTASLVGGRISCFLACRRPSPKISALWQCQSSDGRSASFEFGVASKKNLKFSCAPSKLERCRGPGGISRGGTGHPWRLPRMQWGELFELTLGGASSGSHARWPVKPLHAILRAPYTGPVGACCCGAVQAAISRSCRACLENTTPRPRSSPQTARSKR